MNVDPKQESDITSTFHPSARMFSHSSRGVLTFDLSTWVHVGKMAPSPDSAALFPKMSQLPCAIWLRMENIRSSLWVKINPPYL